MPPERWEALVRLSRGARQRTRSSRFRATAMSRRLRFGADNAVMREAVAASPLRADAAGRPGPRQAVRPAGRRAGVHRRGVGSGPCSAANEDVAALVPHARFSVASESGHDIHQDQPELVIEAIRQVVAGVRNPDTWYDLTSCCTE